MIIKNKLVLYILQWSVATLRTVVGLPIDSDGGATLVLEPLVPETTETLLERTYGQLIFSKLNAISSLSPSGSTEDTPFWILLEVRFRLCQHRYLQVHSTQYSFFSHFRALHFFLIPF
jgi:hypothetical protein